MYFISFATLWQSRICLYVHFISLNIMLSLLVYAIAEMTNANFTLLLILNVHKKFLLYDLFFWKVVCLSVCRGQIGRKTTHILKCFTLFVHSGFQLNRPMKDRLIPFSFQTKAAHTPNHSQVKWLRFYTEHAFDLWLRFSSHKTYDSIALYVCLVLEQFCFTFRRVVATWCVNTHGWRQQANYGVW